MCLGSSTSAQHRVTTSVGCTAPEPEPGTPLRKRTQPTKNVHASDLIWHDFSWHGLQKVQPALRLLFKTDSCRFFVEVGPGHAASDAMHNGCICTEDEKHAALNLAGVPQPRIRMTLAGGLPTGLQHCNSAVCYCTYDLVSIFSVTISKRLSIVPILVLGALPNHTDLELLFVNLHQPPTCMSTHGSLFPVPMPASYDAPFFCCRSGRKGP
jgi:hypothetical protein